MSNSKIFVSVIIPTYNRIQCIERALKSVLNQTYRGFEVIVVDDGSTDGTGKVIQKLQGCDDRIRYFYISNSGVSRARNYGIKRARGDLIAFLDSDDEWLPQKLKKQINLYNEKPYHLCHTEEIWIRNGVRVNPMKKHEKGGGDIFIRSLPLCCISPSSTVVTRDLFQEVGLFDEEFDVCEDYDMWLRVSSRFPVEFISEPLIIKYGGHDDQLSRRFWGNDEYRVKALLKVIESGYIDGEKLESARDVLRKKCSILASGFIKHGNPEKAKFYKNVVELP